MEIQLFPIASLTLLGNNPRSISKDQMDKLCKSMQEDPKYLFNRPVLVNQVGSVYTVYAGNQRVRAAKKLKMKEIPCIIDEDLDEEILHKRIILDNKTYGEFDWDILANEWNVDTLLECGFTEDELVGSVQNIDTNEDKEEKKKKCNHCPKCGAEV